MEIIKNVAVVFLTLSLIETSWALKDENTHNIATSQQNEQGRQEPVRAPALSRVKRQFGYGYGVPYYGIYRRPYPVPVPILIGGGFVGGRGFGGFGGRGFGGRGFGGRGFGGRGFGGRGFGGRGFGGRGIGGRGGFGGGRGGIGGGRGGRG